MPELQKLPEPQVTSVERANADKVSMETTEDHVEKIWKSMKAVVKEEHSNVLNNILGSEIPAYSCKKSLPKREKKKNNNHTKFRLANSYHKTLNYSTGSTKEICSKSRTKPVEDDQKVNNLSQAIIISFMKVGKKKCIQLEDSDDDSDDFTQETQHSDSNLLSQIECRVFRIGYFHSLIRCVSSRLQAIEAFYKAIQKLVSEVDCIAAPLSFLPPYDISRITLTHKRDGAVVSDMADGRHVDSWSLWKQGVHSSLSSQFQIFESLAQSNRINKLNKRPGSLEAVNCLQSILDACGTAIFRLFSDKSEKCRSLAIQCIQFICLGKVDIGKHLAFLIPAILQKCSLPFFDIELQVFYYALDDHEYYKRGGITSLQECNRLSDNGHGVTVIDRCEEVRLAQCELLSCIVRCSMSKPEILDAYYSDFILALQSHTRDPFPELKIAASKLLTQILRVPQWEIGARHFATALARSAIPNMRHHSYSVRIASIGLFESSVSVPDRVKIKAAGSTAINDLVGFKEENVLPVAAFYRAECGVTVNTLAELSTDKNFSVRFRCCQMLSFFMTCLPDRYDYHQKLLPYVLLFYHDRKDETRKIAIKAIEICGQQYEAEHPDEIVERRQYGVDGDKLCNYDQNLPSIFDGRPRLGARLFVRHNSKRFFLALLKELTSWISKTKEQSIKLLQVLVVYCEEHLTMDSHNTILCIIEAIQLIEKEDKDISSIGINCSLLDTLELLGKYISPDVYVPLLLQRIVGKTEAVTTFSEDGHHNEVSKSVHLKALKAMISGSNPKKLLDFKMILISSLTYENSIEHCIMTTVAIECLKTLVTLLEKLKCIGMPSHLTKHAGTIEIIKIDNVTHSCSVFLSKVVSESKDSDITRLARNGLHLLTYCL